MRHLSAYWVKNAASGEYLDLLRLNLHAPYFNAPTYAVYVIWYTAPIKAPVIKIGHGVIRDELQKARNSPQVLEFGNSGQLKVSWIEVDQAISHRVQAYLYGKYQPILNDAPAIPNKSLVAVNLL